MSFATYALNPFDMLLTDVWLPEGLCLCLLQEGNRRLPPFVVTMSGFDVEPQIFGGVDAVRHHLIKPFAPEELDALLEELANERALAAMERQGAGYENQV